MKNNKYNKDDLLACGQGTLFREKSPRLPVGNMLMLDSVDHISEKGGLYGKGEIISSLRLSPDHWFFQCHFIGDPIMPGCLALEGIWQSLGFYMAWSGHEGKGRALAGDVKFIEQIVPSIDVITFHVHIKKIMNRPFSLVAGEGELLVDGKTFYKFKNFRLGILPSDST